MCSLKIFLRVEIGCQYMYIIYPTSIETIRSRSRFSRVIKMGLVTSAKSHFYSIYFYFYFVILFTGYSANKKL